MERVIGIDLGTTNSCVAIMEGEAPVVIRDAAVAADYVASWASFYQDQIARPWPEVVQEVGQDVQAVIDHEGAFVVSSDLAAFVCR